MTCGKVAAVGPKRQKDRNTMNTNDKPHDELRITADWPNPRIKVRRANIKKNATLQRKVITKGIVNLDLGELFGKIEMLLRAGYEVRCNESIRLFPMSYSDLRGMYVGAATIGVFHTRPYDGIHPTTFYRGQKVNGPKMAEEQRRRHEDYLEHIHNDVVEVTPDMIVECPRCSLHIRVGKKISA